MALGTVKMNFRNGKDLEMEFTCRMLVDGGTRTGGQPRLKLYQVFAVGSLSELAEYLIPEVLIVGLYHIGQCSCSSCFEATIELRIRYGNVAGYV